MAEIVLVQMLRNLVEGKSKDLRVVFINLDRQSEREVVRRLSGSLIAVIKVRKE